MICNKAYPYDVLLILVCLMTVSYSKVTPYKMFTIIGLYRNCMMGSHKMVPVFKGYYNSFSSFTVSCSNGNCEEG